MRMTPEHAAHVLPLRRLDTLVTRLVAIALLVAGALAVQAGAQTKPLPPGHPPTGGGAPAIPGPPPDAGTGPKSLTWTVPAGWTTETPSSSMRRAQYRIPGPGGPAECVVFYFGPGQGGDARANAERWGSQFRRADGAPVGNALKISETKVGDIHVTRVEVSGTYVGGMGGGPAGASQANSELLGAIAEGPDAPWFFRAIGPRATVDANRAAFDAMIHSLKHGS
jgi:hypothetical protein